MKFGKRYKQLCQDLMPHHEDLQDVPDEATSDWIWETMTRQSEYLGGMASVIIELTKRDLACEK